MGKTMRPSLQRNRGFTLIELMIAVTLGLLILAALTSFFVRTSANRTELERNSRQIENGRYAVSSLRDDLQLAGFFADISQPSTTVWKLPEACVTDPAAVPTNWGFKPDKIAPELPVPLFVYADGTGKPAGCTPNHVANTDVIVVRRLHTEPVAVAGLGATPNQVFVQVSECKDDDDTTPFVVDVGKNAANFKLRKLDCKTAADVRRFREQLYYVRDYSVTAGDGIPTLVRVELDGDAASVVTNTVPLVEGIENLKVDWGVDADGNGSPETWKRCDVATPCVAADWSNVTAARIFVLSRNLEPTTGFKDDKTYLLGLSGMTAATNDAYKRHVYSAVISMPNRAGPREPIFAS
jgi:type IV pilus assembly protein PilW